MKVGVYAGSFDPITLGHADIINRAAEVFDKLVVAIGNNPAKKSTFSVQNRIELIDNDFENVVIRSFNGLLTDFCRTRSCHEEISDKDITQITIVRGLRAVTDFEYELAMAHVNSKLGYDTMFLATKPEYSFISSSVVRELISYSGWERKVKDYISGNTMEWLKKNWHVTY